jgi:phosphoribosylanthranilate isomerase
VPHPAVFKLPKRTRIKFCGLVRPQDVLDAVYLGADAIGFNFYPNSSRFVSPDLASDLRRLLPSWVSAVGLFVNEAAPEIQRVAAKVGLDVIQLHGDESPEFAINVGEACERPWWRAARCRNQADLLHCIEQFPGAESLLLDSYSPMFGGTGETFDWTILSNIEQLLGTERYSAMRSKMILAGGLNETNVGQAIEKIQAMAVDVSSGIEGSNPREKDAKKMAAFIAAVISADNTADSQHLLRD